MSDTANRLNRLNRLNRSNSQKGGACTLSGSDAGVFARVDWMKSRPLHNPYYDLAAVRQPEMFFGREDLLRQLFSLVAHQQSVSLVGPHHIGKSSILRSMSFPEIQQRFEEDLSHHIFVWLDLREFLSHETADDFFATVTGHIVAQCSGKVRLEEEAEEAEEHFEQFRRILEQVKEQGHHLVLLMDAFDNIARNKHFDLEFFSFLRSQATKVSYVTASTAPLAKVCHRAVEESPFFNIFAMYEIEPLTREDARELIRVPAANVGIIFTDKEIEWVLRQAGHHPFFIQRVCHYLFEEKCSIENGQSINWKRVQLHAYNELQHHFEARWERLEEPQQELLRNEAQHKEKQERALPELSESSLFRKFVRDKYQLHLFSQLKVKDVEEVLKEIDDLRALGESDLKHLKMVAQRLKNNGHSSPIERGVAVRSVLTEAFERLQGDGVRNDTAPGWMLYNILHYRYFKHRLKNEQICARLGLSSTRKFFRERQNAIDSLYNILMEMEVLAGDDED
jgi:hypothetical protein